jgi:hypothetical protein
VAEVIGHRQALDASAIGQAVRYKIHASHIVDLLRQLQGHLLAW